MKGNYNGKYFSVLGDSISTLSDVSRPYDAAYYEGMLKLETRVYCIKDTWWGMVIGSLGGELLVNNSFSGSMVTKRKSCVIESYGCSDARTSDLSENGRSPDVIFLFMGYNDWGCGAEIYGENAENDLTVFSVAYEAAIRKLRANYPGAEIMCFTLPVSKYEGREEFPYLYCGRHIGEYCEAIEEIARKNGCRVIDLYRECEPFDTSDGFHPNADGMKTIADAVLSII